MFPSEPPENLNWKAIPLVVAIFGLFTGLVFGALLLTQRTGLFPPTSPPAFQSLVDTGGAVFRPGVAHVPSQWQEGPHLLVVRGADTWTAVFETGPACAAAAVYLTDASTGAADAASCHPTRM
jgi:hypothetical protein